MSNAVARAHVVSPMADLQTPATSADLESQNHHSSPQQHSDSDDAVEVTTPQSRREKRKQKRQKHDSALATPSDTDEESRSTSRKPPNNPPKQLALNTIPASLSQMSTAKNAAQKAYPLLICSIGNPGSTYANTLHSAGHVLTTYIAQRKAYKPFTKGLSGLTSAPDTTHMSFGLIQGFRRVEGAPVGVDEDWTFWQSTSLMNVSGKGVGRAYTEWLRTMKSKYNDNTLEGRLIVVHDELESALGKVTVRDGSASAKGHNGLKSCQSSLRGKWWRVGVGIGRPESREPDVVARYVLRKMSGNERNSLENSAVGVVKALEDIAAGVK